MIIHLGPLPVASFLGSFLLGFPALFSIVNPVGSALIFKEVTQNRDAAERQVLARRVAIYAALILLGSLWIGSYILEFFGISLGALRIAGGLVVTVSAWALLMEPHKGEKQDAAEMAPTGPPTNDIAFFPLTMPLTTGPGTMAVAIALSSQRPASDVGTFAFFGGVSLAAICIAALVWLSYSWSDRLLMFLGKQGAEVLSRLVAFLLLCIGVQIVSTGVENLAATVLHVAPR